MYERFTQLVAQGIPVFFLTDFKGERLSCYPLDRLAEHDIEFSFSPSAAPAGNTPHKPIFYPVSKEEYKMRFERVLEQIRSGNTYLLNLTQPTKIVTPHSLKSIYAMAHAPYKMRFGDSFVCFSPEPFVTIDETSRIHTFPMKGTIDAAAPNAVESILNDPKETAEHTMIVDLLRNDIGIVARNVKVEKFRYITTINTGNKRLHQVSSHISGQLDQNWRNDAGKILRALLPAGSISGTPKKKTVEIIEETEGYERGYFTGVFGYFDGERLYSAVTIRYIERDRYGELFYKSGGGITAESNWQSEYDEMIDKIYIP